MWNCLAMRKYTQFFIYGLLFFVPVVCIGQADNVDYSKLISIKVSADGQDDLAGLVEDYKYISLETTPESIISKIDKVLYQSGKFYILDAQVQALFIFDKEGKFISKIERSGHGPGEYIYLMDFDIDSLGNIYLLDLNRKAILKYDQNGKFEKKHQLSHYLANIAIMDPSTILTYQNVALSSEVSHKLTVFKNGELVNSFLPIPKHNRITLLKPFSLTHSGNKVLFNADLSDTIFSVSSHVLEARYFLDFGKYAISPKQRSNHEYFTQPNRKVVEGHRINNCFETADYFTCTYNLQGKTWSLYYALKDKTTYVSYCTDCDETKQKVINDFRAIGVCGDYFIGYLQTHMIEKYKAGIKGKPARMAALIGKDNMDFIESLDLYDNPVLVLYKMK